MEIAINILAGFLGGAFLGVKGYIESHKEGEAFDWYFFASTMTVPVAAGLLSGLIALSPLEAFTAGFAGKAIQEIVSKYKK